MPNPYPAVLRERAVRAYEDGTARYRDVASTFGISLATLVRWVQRARETGLLVPFDKAGGWHSPVDLPLLHRLVYEKPDRTTDELTRVYTYTTGRPRARRVCIGRASCARCSGRDTSSKTTIALGRTRSRRRPG